jgi:hypothetical protein
MASLWGVKGGDNVVVLEPNRGRRVEVVLRVTKNLICVGDRRYRKKDGMATDWKIWKWSKVEVCE